MSEYQISVSVNGKFLFRTDWIDDEQEAELAAMTIKQCMAMAKVVIYSRSKTMSIKEVI